MNKLLVVVVNFRTPELTIESLRSLAEELPQLGGQVEVVDNASGDDSAVKIAQAIEQESWQSWARLRESPRNGGFGAGNNVALRPALESITPPDYFFLLNPDTQVKPGALRALLDFMEEHAQVGIVGSRIEAPDGSPRVSAFRFHSITGELLMGAHLGLLDQALKSWRVASPIRNEPHPTDWVSGAALFVRREVLQQVGLFDEDYFLYYEEVDLCRRAAEAGWGCYYVPQSVVVHLEGQSTGVSSDAPVRRPLHPSWFASRRHYFKKHHGALYARLADVTYAAALTSWRLRRRLQGKPDEDPPQLLRDFVRHTFLS